jgi:hypothetical protein
MKKKFEIFKDTFHGRNDIVPRYWMSRDGKSGYSPLCKNEWKGSICHKPCWDCQNADYIPLSYSLILDHFKGKHILGIYPLLKDSTCYFIAADFDNHNNDRNPLEDVKAYFEVCQVQDIPCYVLRSKSGRGYHVYIFFNSPVPAWKARAVAFALLQEAAVIGDDVELSSFDRLFPNQDEPTGKGLGNLIALPLQGQAARKEHTLFLNPDNGFVKPFGNQWDVLTNLKKVDELSLDELIESWDLKRSQHKANNGGMTNPEGWLLKALMGVEEGNPGRDTTGTKIAGYFVDKLPKKDILTILSAWNTRNKPPLDESTIRKIVDSVYRYRKRNADEWEINLHFAGCEKSCAEAPASG